jgi:hypothetical protein
VLAASCQRPSPQRGRPTPDQLAQAPATFCVLFQRLLPPTQLGQVSPKSDSSQNIAGKLGLQLFLNPPAAINHGLAGRNDSLSVLRETDVKTGNAGVEVHAGQPISGRRNIGSKGESLPARAPFFLGSTASNS